MLKALRQLFEWFWVWLGGDLPATEAQVVIEPGSDQSTYEVQSGDTLSSIARRFSTSAWTLADLNDLDNPSQIHIGQRLLISGPDAPLSAAAAPAPRPEPALEAEPGPFMYIVQTGDTLSAISRRFGVTPGAIVDTNQIRDPDHIWPGQRLLIPGPESQPELEPSPLKLEPTQLTMPEPAPELIPEPLPPAPGTSLPPIPWTDDSVRAIYVSYFALGREERRRRVFDLVSKTEINALVIDVKGDFGMVSYPTRVALAHDIGAAQPTARDLDEFLGFFKGKNVYTVARIVAFRDNFFANAHPGLAVHRQDGGVWQDRDGLAWIDPFVQDAWEYNANLAEEAVRLGFDEIQFDYVRFPTRSQDGTPLLSRSLNRETRVAAITAFLNFVHGRLEPLGVRVAANVFGYACWRTDDSLIGQDIGHMARYLDILCPMLYPSTFGSGIPQHEYAVAYPYEIVCESMKRAVHLVEPLGCRVRPWIQDFPDFRFDKRVYGPAEIRAQIQGSFDGGGAGYMAWDPRVKYTKEAYFQNAIDMSLSDDYN